jgi:hypothetical protein
MPPSGSEVADYLTRRSFRSVSTGVEKKDSLGWRDQGSKAYPSRLSSCALFQVNVLYS